MNLGRKINFLVALLSLLNVCYVFAQDNNAALVSGIYLNSQDYVRNKLSYSVNCKTDAEIKLNDFLSSRYIYVSANGKRNKLYKDSIWGYRNCKNENFRFYKNRDEEFQILESKGIVLYLSYIRVSSNNGKINQLKPAYFFSKTNNSEILPLTIANLKRAFPDNIKFHDMLDVTFVKDETLSEYSAIDGVYKINYFFNKSIQK